MIFVFMQKPVLPDLGWVSVRFWVVTSEPSADREDLMSSAHSVEDSCRVRRQTTRVDKKIGVECRPRVGEIRTQ